MAGIHRSVYLRSTGKVYLEDVFAQGRLDRDLTEGKLEVQVRGGFEGIPEAGWKVEVQLLDPSGAMVKKDLYQGEIPTAEETRINLGHLLRFSIPVPTPLWWTSETPHSTSFPASSPEGTPSPPPRPSG